MNNKVVPVILISLFLSVAGCTISRSGMQKNGIGPILLEERSIDKSGEYAFREENIDPARTAIIIVDMWHLGGAGYVRPDSSFEGTSEGYFYQQQICDSINETICAARKLGMTIIHAPAEQSYLYKSHPARKNVIDLQKSKYPWSEKPGWNYDQLKIPFSTFEYEYEYAYPNTPKERRRPGTTSYGQNPRIVIAANDYITDDPEELWNILQDRQLNLLIFMGGSTNMCLAGRPYGLLNMQKYGKEVLLDRNYAHLVHRIPHGWNGDIKNPKYGPFYTNERNSVQVINYFEANICPTIDGMKLREIANQHGGYSVLLPSVAERNISRDSIKISFQTQLIEVMDGYRIDVGWEYAPKANGLTYGWNKLKIKDGIREDFDPVYASYISARTGDMWRLDAPFTFSCRLTLAGKGELLINQQPYTLHGEGQQEVQFNFRDSLKITGISGTTKWYALEMVRKQ